MKLKKSLLHDFDMFIKSRINSGYAGYAMNYAKNFALFVIENYQDEEEVTENMLTAYLSFHPHQNHNTYLNVIAEIRSFTRYLNYIGKNAYIPDEKYSTSKSRLSFHPYLLSDDEMRLFFNHLDSYDENDLYEGRENKRFVFPVMYRMMYCCGMRPQEVLNLRTEDINLDTGEIYIRKTKSYKERHIFMSNDMIELCKLYSENYCAFENEYYFSHINVKKYDAYHLHACINHFRKITGFNKECFRSYCFRHSFATDNIKKWIENEEDLNVLIPYLSVYMGHTNLNDTLYYIHLLPENFRNNPKVDWESLKKIYPEVGDNDDD